MPEWNAGHIDGTIHIHGGTLEDRFDDISWEKPVAVVCGSGYQVSQLCPCSVLLVK